MSEEQQLGSWEEGNVKKTQVEIPAYLTTENKFNVAPGFWQSFVPEAQLAFNFCYEYMDRNPHSVIPTDVFKLTGFTNEQIIIVQKLKDAAHFNFCILMAQYLSNEFGYDSPQDIENQ